MDHNFDNHPYSDLQLRNLMKVTILGKPYRLLCIPIMLTQFKHTVVALGKLIMLNVESLLRCGFCIARSMGHSIQQPPPPVHLREVARP